MSYPLPATMPMATSATSLSETQESSSLQVKIFAAPYLTTCSSAEEPISSSLPRAPARQPLTLPEPVRFCGKPTNLWAPKTLIRNCFTNSSSIRLTRFTIRSPDNITTGSTWKLHLSQSSMIDTPTQSKPPLTSVPSTAEKSSKARSEESPMSIVFSLPLSGPAN